MPGSCAKCHSAGGLPQFIKEGAVVSQHPANGFQCATCHNDLKEFTRYETTDVKFPSGAVIDSGDADTNLCMNCHQGRESTVCVNKLIGDTEDDTQAESLRFLNPHYFAAGATRYGTEAKGAYEYADKTYVGYFQHGGDSGPNNCTDCHSTHTQEVDWETCTECHEEVTAKEDLQKIRYNLADYRRQWRRCGRHLLRDPEHARHALCRDAAVCDGHRRQGHCLRRRQLSVLLLRHQCQRHGGSPTRSTADNAFNTWTPRLLRAAYNYQYSGKDPGSFAHNGKYIIQTLYDSLEDIGGDVSGMTRPESE